MSNLPGTGTHSPKPSGIYIALSETNNNYGNNRQAREAAAGQPSLQGDANHLRRTATELARRELKISPARSEAAEN